MYNNSNEMTILAFADVIAIILNIMATVFIRHNSLKKENHTSICLIELIGSTATNVLMGLVYSTISTAVIFMLFFQLQSK